MHYDWAIEILRDDGRAIEQMVVTPDWRAALDWAHCDGIRAGVLPAVTRTGPDMIQPVWDARIGEPYVSGFRVTVRAGGREVVREIPRRYLQRLAYEVSAEVARRHQIPAGTDLRWVASARPATAAAPPGDAADDLFAIEPESRPWPVENTPLAPFLAAATHAGVTDQSLPVLPVFLPHPVLEEARDLARQAGDVETGGALIGKLHRDTAIGADGRHELFVEITAQVPAAHTVAASTTLTFTAASWAAVHATLAARKRNEILVGWHHSHLDWCRLRGCPPERRRTCSGAHPFFSAEDVHLHATCFPAGYQVALLISDSAATGGLTASVYGWSQGLVVSRPYHLLTKGVTHAENHIP